MRQKEIGSSNQSKDHFGDPNVIFLHNIQCVTYQLKAQEEPSRIYSSRRIAFQNFSDLTNVQCNPATPTNQYTDN